MLRQLAIYYAKEANHLFLIRIAQGMCGPALRLVNTTNDHVWSFASSPGLLHMGKGLMTLNPYHSTE